VWDAATGEQLGILRDVDGAVDAVAYSPDGRLLVTGEERGDVGCGTRRPSSTRAHSAGTRAA
jgi:hypothetical protein